MTTKLKLVAGAALALACAQALRPGRPTNFPTREIEAIVPCAAGGAGVPTFARSPMGDQEQAQHTDDRRWSQPGAGGITGANAVHRSKSAATRCCSAAPPRSPPRRASRKPNTISADSGR